MAFNVRRYLIRVRGGQQYLPVSARLVWFRDEHPDWSIETHPLHLDIEGGCVVYQAVVKDASGRVIATASKMETRDDFADFVEKAETGAVGRALAMCGYGTQFAPELSEGDLESGRIAFADTPQPIRGEEEEAAARTSEPPAEAMVCADCGRPLRKPQYDLSMTKFHRPLCPNCQRRAAASP
ncbi:MAG: hypothetical protein WHS44_12525 [Fimbriimonadales bacterium]|nr:MAG: hypothetical protein KatS3mg018_1419 [Fimbriimonadales bacterium]